MPAPRHVDAAVGGELRGVDEQLGAVSVGELGQLGDRPDLAGDVRGAGDGDQVDPRPRRAKRPLARVQQLVRRAGEREQPEIVAPPGKHVGVMLDRAREHPRARGQRGRQDVDRLGRVADEDDGVVGTGADELGDASRARPRTRRWRRWDFSPLPRCTLLYQGTNASTASHTAAITGVLAA